VGINQRGAYLEFEELLDLGPEPAQCDEDKGSSSLGRKPKLCEHIRGDL